LVYFIRNYQNIEFSLVLIILSWRYSSI